MKYLIALIVFSLVGCSGVQLEGIKYTMPNGQVTSCMPNPDREGWMICTYMDGANEVSIGVKRDMISGRDK